MEMAKSFMEKVKKMRVKEERRNLAKAVLITEGVRKKGVGEAKAEQIVRKFGGWPHIHRRQEAYPRAESRASMTCKEH